MFENKTEKSDDIELIVDVSVENPDDGYQTDEENGFAEETKGFFRSLRDEFAERTTEDHAFDKAVFEEEKRLEAAREEAKKKNVLRKIKFVDNKYAKAEKERDELALKKFREAEQSRLNAIRSERSSTLVKENKKSIAIAVVIILVICAVIGVIASQKHKATVAKNYNHAVECIMTEQYEEAFDILEKMNYKDSQALCDYSETQMLLHGYKGKPDEALARLMHIEGMEHESVKKQCQNACGEVNKAVDIQADIDKIDITSADTISEEVINKVEESKKNLNKRYTVLLDTEKCDIAARVIYNRDNETDAWKLMLELAELGDVTLDSKETIARLRETYDGLTDEDKKAILNYDILVSAESRYLELQKEEDERVAAEKKKIEENEEAVINSDEIFYASDIPSESSETVDLGYIKIRARSWGYRLDESWHFSLLDRNDSEPYSFDVKIITDDQVESKDERTFNKIKSNKVEERNYVFTMTGYGTWTPTSDDSGSFTFVPDKILNIEYNWWDDPSDDALLYN